MIAAGEKPIPAQERPPVHFMLSDGYQHGSILDDSTPVNLAPDIERNKRGHAEGTLSPPMQNIVQRLCRPAHLTSRISLTRLVATPGMYISARATLSAFSGRCAPLLSRLLRFGVGAQDANKKALLF
jgi:hypothetical protein